MGFDYILSGSYNYINYIHCSHANAFFPLETWQSSCDFRKLLFTSRTQWVGLFCWWFYAYQFYHSSLKLNDKIMRFKCFPNANNLHKQLTNDIDILYLLWPLKAKPLFLHNRAIFSSWFYVRAHYVHENTLKFKAVYKLLILNQIIYSRW